MRADGPWKRAAQELKLKFLGEAQALIHGDLHSGSIMVTESETYAIDPEFAFYGPMGFDIGALLGNFYLAFFAQSGHEAKTGARDDYRDWILSTAEQVFTLFDRRFRALWNSRHASETFAPGLFAERRRPGGAQRGAGCLYAPPVRRVAGLRRLQDDPAHPGSGPCRGPREHRQSRPARRMREAGAQTCPHLSW